MTLNEKLRTATLENLEELDLLWMHDYAKRNEETLQFLYNRGIIDDSSIEGALETAVFNQARQDYAMMTDKRRAYQIPADHVGRPDCLAYALANGAFSKREVKKIPFDHGETAETFVQGYDTKHLLSHLREELLNPETAPKPEGDYDIFDSHPVCSSCAR